MWFRAVSSATFSRAATSAVVRPSASRWRTSCRRGVSGGAPPASGAGALFRHQASGAEHSHRGAVGVERNRGEVDVDPLAVVADDAELELRSSWSLRSACARAPYVSR